MLIFWCSPLTSEDNRNNSGHLTGRGEVCKFRYSNYGCETPEKAKPLLLKKLLFILETRNKRFVNPDEYRQIRLDGEKTGMRTKSWRTNKNRFQLEQLENRQLLAADVFISEIAAVNDNILVDEDGDNPDWIEIYNAGPDAVNLDGWHLTDDADELDKWSFPARELGAGNFLLVYASDKDRSNADGPLHANFKLTSDGEYLALTQATGTAVEVVSEFSPQYPFQFSDISYGTAQSVDETTYLPADAPAKLLLPTDNSLGSSWTAAGFDDSGWASASASVGYQTTVPGFTVEDAKSNGSLVNLTNALSVLNGTGQVSQTTVIAQVINFYDSTGAGGGGANFGGDAQFPNNTSADDNDFAIRATGKILITQPGTYTFGINSDDGARLRINGSNVINDNTLHGPQDTFGQTALTAGEHDIELIYFERGGGAEVELFAARGNFASFNSQFELVGDTANGGIPVFTSPTGTTSGFGAQFSTDIGDEMLNQSTDVFLRVPFVVSDPTAIDSLTLRMNYDDGFVAYLNGAEVARRNAPAGEVPANSTSTIDRPRLDAGFTESIDVTPFLGALNVGENILAIHGLNDAIDSDEFLIHAELAEIAVSSGELLYFPDPTPGSFNPSTGVEGFLTHEITFGQEHGFFTDAFPLTLSAATAGTTIRYTTDGSEPTVNDAVYAGPITIDRTTTVRARAFKDGLDPSFVETRTYLFLEDIVEQSRASTIAAGFPSSGSINGQSLDYGMDPDIVNSDTWGPQLNAALTQIPSMSVVMEVDDLLGSSDGIFVNAGSHGKEWERPASLELINPDGSEGFQVNAGIRIRGGFSRSGNNPKHAFRLFFREEYGDSKLEYPLFQEEGVSEFDKFDLRTTQNYSWAFQGNGNNAFVRDVFSRDMQREMGHPYTRSRFYHLYINGQYWGLFQTQERAEARYAASYFGGDPDDYDIVKSAGSSGGYQNEATDGNLDAYERLADFFYQPNGLGDVNQNDYMRAQGLNPDGSVNPDYERLLDVDNVIDYAIITYFTGDRDGPGSRFTAPRVNNYFGMFNRENPDGFKFFEHDSEHSLDTGENNMVSPQTSGGAQFRYFNPHWMHEQLANNNTEYLTRFMDRVTELTFNDGLLTPDNTKAMIDARAAEFDMAIIAESARWGDAQRNAPFTKTDWENAVNRTRSWLDARGPVFLDQLRDVGWFPDALPPQFRVNNSPQHGGPVGSNDKITLISTEALSFNTTLINDGSTWKYLDDGSDQGTAWRAPDFDDSGWDSGRAELGYGDGGERTELSFGPDSGDKYVTTYFRRTFDVTDPSKLEAVRLRLRRDDGAVVYLNGQEIVRSNMPGGTIRFDTSAAGVAGGSEETTFFNFEVDPAALVPGANVMAVEIHQNIGGGGTVTSSDISFDLELQGAEAPETGTASNIYYTTDGTDPRLPGGDLSPAALPLAEQGFSLPTSKRVVARTFIGGEWGPAVAAQFTVSTGELPGDLNNDALLDAADIDALAAALRAGETDAKFDLNADSLVNDADLVHMIENIFKTAPGDADLDQDVDFADFLVLSSNFGKADVGWASGDFDGDGKVGFTDFLLLSANYGADEL